MKKVQSALFWLPPLLFFTFYLYHSWFYFPHDFSNSYFPAYFLLKGEFGNWIFDPYLFNKKIFDAGFQNVYGSFNPNPPFIAIFYSPFALLPFKISKLLFNFLSIGLFLFSTDRLCKYLQLESKIIIVILPFVFFIPLKNQILFGQTYFLLFFLLIEGFLAYNKGKLIWSSALWALAIFIKVFPLIVFLLLVVKKDLRATAWLLGCCVTLLLISLSIIDTNIWQIYFSEILPSHSNGSISAAFTSSYQSFSMLIKYLFTEDDVLNQYLVYNSPLLYSAALALFNGFILTICISTIIHCKGDALSFGLLLLGGILISPFGSTYSSLLLLIVMIGSWQSLTPKKILWVVGTIFFICNLPISLFADLPIIFQFPRLFLMVGLLCMIFIFVFARINFSALILLATMYTLPIFLKENSSRLEKDVHFLTNENHLIIFDYGIKEGYLFYNYWNTNGSNLQLTDHPISSLDTVNVTISDNQVFYQGKQLTFSKDKKRKPALINQCMILYLSDKGKGTQFYTLRSMPIK